MTMGSSGVATVKEMASSVNPVSLIRLMQYAMEICACHVQTVHIIISTLNTIVVKAGLTPNVEDAGTGM